MSSSCGCATWRSSSVDGVQIHKLSRWSCCPGVGNQGIELLRCSFRSCDTIIIPTINSDALVSDCVFQDFIVVAQIFYNTKGSVEFRRNSPLDEGYRVQVIIDSSSTTPKHDFPDILFRHEDGNLAKFPSKKEASNHSKKFANNKFRLQSEHELGMDPSGYDSSIDPHSVKRCKRCDLIEERLVKDKFKFCSTCERVCYCSRKCQLADWKDHKVVCSIMVTG